MAAAKHGPWMTAATEHIPAVPLLQSTGMSARDSVGHTETTTDENIIAETITKANDQRLLDIVAEPLAESLDCESSTAGRHPVDKDKYWWRKPMPNVAPVPRPPEPPAPPGLSIIKKLEEEAKFLRNQSGHILNLIKDQRDQLTAQGEQLTAQGDMLKDILRSVTPFKTSETPDLRGIRAFERPCNGFQTSGTPMYVFPTNTWKSVFKCECHIVKPRRPLNKEENANTSTTLIPVSVRCHFKVTSMPLRCCSEFTPGSNRCRIDFASVSQRLHSELKTILFSYGLRAF